jgi:N-acetylglucosamine-6-phosphate deacetylase
VLDGPGSVEAVARRLVRYGVTSFCPTSVASPLPVLEAFLAEVRQLRASPPADAARVRCAHLESHFLNPAFAGAQPRAWLCAPAPLDAAGEDGVTARGVLETIARAGADVGIVTLAPELPGGLDLVRALSASGRLVSLGHTAADAEMADAAFEAGARHVTHLFNRMAPMTARAPGLLGVALSRPEVRVELIGDGHHVHPALCRVTLAAKGPDGVLAITDATAAAGLPEGQAARLGGRRIVAGVHAAHLDDGTLAGAIRTMDQVFRRACDWAGSPVQAARVCASTPARALGLRDTGVLRVGAAADLALLDSTGAVHATVIAGVPIPHPSAGR